MVAILMLAMISGGLAAIAALISGWHFLAALALYSGFGVLSVLLLLLYTAVMSAFQKRRTGLIRTDATA